LIPNRSNSIHGSNRLRHLETTGRVWQSRGPSAGVRPEAAGRSDRTQGRIEKIEDQIAQ
jgi:hypothetical protein